MNYEKVNRAKARDAFRANWRLFTLKKEHRRPRGWNRSGHREAIKQLRQMGTPISRRAWLERKFPDLPPAFITASLSAAKKDGVVFVRYVGSEERNAAKRLRRARRA